MLFNYNFKIYKLKINYYSRDLHQIIFLAPLSQKLNEHRTEIDEYIFSAPVNEHQVQRVRT